MPVDKKLKEELVHSALYGASGDAKETASTLMEISEGLRAEAHRLSDLAHQFPDLKKKVGRWKKVVFTSPAANARATGFDMRHNCGCCADSPLEVWPYAETLNGRVYSEPPEFRVGERDPSFGADKAYEGWDKKMRDAGIPDAIVSAVAEHFKSEAKKIHEAVDEIYGDGEA